MQLFKNKRSLIIIGGAVLVLMVAMALWAGAYDDINSQYPSPMVIRSTDETVDILGEFQIQAKNARAFSMRDFFDKFEIPEDFQADMGFEQDGEDKFVLTDFTIIYAGEKETTPGEIIDKYMIYLQANKWVSPYDALLIRFVNDIETIPESVGKGDSFTVTLPFNALKSNFSDDDWNSLNNGKFQAVINFYPRRYIFDVK